MGWQAWPAAVGAERPLCRTVQLPLTAGRVCVPSSPACFRNMFLAGGHLLLCQAEGHPSAGSVPAFGLEVFRSQSWPPSATTTAAAATAGAGAKRKAAEEGEGADRCGSRPCAARSSQPACRMVSLTVVEWKSSTPKFTVFSCPCLAVNLFPSATPDCPWWKGAACTAGAAWTAQQQRGPGGSLVPAASRLHQQPSAQMKLWAGCPLQLAAALLRAQLRRSCQGREPGPSTCSRSTGGHGFGQVAGT